MKYIKDFGDLPTQVNKGDFVLNLAAGVTHARGDVNLASIMNAVAGPDDPSDEVRGNR